MKKQLLTAASLLCTFFSYAQTFTPPSYAEINDNYRNHVSNVFGILEYNKRNSLVKQKLFNLYLQ